MPAQLARWLEHVDDEGDAEAAFKLTLFNVCATPRNILNAERLLRQLHTDGNQKTALQLRLLQHALQDGPDGDHATLEFFPEAAARGDADAITYCCVLHELCVGIAKNIARALALFRTLGFYILPSAHILISGPRPARRHRSFGRKKAVLFLIYHLIRPFPFSISTRLGFDLPNPANFISVL